MKDEELIKALRIKISVTECILDSLRAKLECLQGEPTWVGSWNDNE